MENKQDYETSYKNEVNKNKLLLNNFHSVEKELENLRKINTQLSLDINILMAKYIQVLEENIIIYKNKIQELMGVSEQEA